MLTERSLPAKQNKKNDVICVCHGRLHFRSEEGGKPGETRGSSRGAGRKEEMEVQSSLHGQRSEGSRASSQYEVHAGLH